MNQWFWGSHLLVGLFCVKILFHFICFLACFTQINLLFFCCCYGSIVLHFDWKFNKLASFVECLKMDNVPRWPIILYFFFIWCWLFFSLLMLIAHCIVFVVYLHSFPFFFSRLVHISISFGQANAITCIVC